MPNRADIGDIIRGSAMGGIDRHQNHSRQSQEKQQDKSCRYQSHEQQALNVFACHHRDPVPIAPPPVRW
jgi:hypothetical protein